MSACWRALGQQPGVELEVIALSNGGNAKPASIGGPGAETSGGIGLAINAPFDQKIISGFSCRLLNQREQDDSNLVASLVIERRPDILILAGWFHRPYIKLATHPQLRHLPRVMVMDTPWKLTLLNFMEGMRQVVGRVWLRNYLSGMSAVVVAGERSWQYARLLNIPEKKLIRGAYGIDYNAFSPLYEQRLASPDGWPRRFLYMGRYESSKGIDILLEAYARYCKSVKDPWPLTCCGKGEDEVLITQAASKSNGLIENRGFVQPFDQPAVLRDCGAFVLASRFDPWPLVVVEACAAGFPVLCSEACGSAVENVRPFYNGLLAATGDVKSLCRGMRWLHEHYALLPEWGRRSQHFAAAYAAELWAVRWRAMLDQVTAGD